MCLVGESQVVTRLWFGRGECVQSEDHQLHKQFLIGSRRKWTLRLPSLATGARDRHVLAYR